MKKAMLKTVAIQIILAEAVGGLAAALSGNIGSDYRAFNQPPLSPPGWLFPVVWVILYALMGISAALVMEASAPQDAKANALKFYIGQLIINFLWPIIFFRFENFWMAFVFLLALDLLVAVTLIKFWRIRPAAGWLLIPYALWILFATYLNWGVAQLNP